MCITNALSVISSLSFVLKKHISNEVVNPLLDNRTTHDLCDTIDDITIRLVKHTREQNVIILSLLDEGKIEEAKKVLDDLI